MNTITDHGGKKLKVQVFECDGKRVGCSLPKDRNELQIVFVQPPNQLVVCLPTNARIDLAMALLSADGARVNVTLSQPSPDCTVCGKPVRPVRGEVRKTHKKCEAKS